MLLIIFWEHFLPKFGLISAQNALYSWFKYSLKILELKIWYVPMLEVLILIKKKKKVKYVLQKKMLFPHSIKILTYFWDWRTHQFYILSFTVVYNIRIFFSLKFSKICQKYKNTMDISFFLIKKTTYFPKTPSANYLTTYLLPPPYTPIFAVTERKHLVAL